MSCCDSRGTGMSLKVIYPLRASTAPTRPAAGVALHARAVAQQGEVAALAAALALVALDLGFCPQIGLQVLFGETRLRHRVQLNLQLPRQVIDLSLRLLGLRQRSRNLLLQ